MSDRVGSPADVVRNNWRVLVLVALLLASVYFLFWPGAPITGPASAADANSSVADTNMQFGIDLAGGARITAPLHGHYVEDVGVTEDNNDEIVRAVASSMNVSLADVETSETTPNPEDDYVEVKAAGNQSAFVAGLENAGLDVSERDVQRGVRDDTREEAVEVLNYRLGQSGFGGGSVTQLHERDPTQVRVESPGQNLDQLEQLVEREGEVRIVAHSPNESNERGYDRRFLYDNDGIDVVRQAQPSEGDREGGYVGVTLTEPAAERMTRILQEEGFDQSDAWGNCSGDEDPGPGEYCLITYVDDDVVFSGGMTSGLGELFVAPGDGGEAPFLQSRSYRLQTTTFAEAQDLRIDLVAGALPAPMNMEQASQMYISPELADDFRLNSLLVGLIAVLAVVTVVFLRYGDVEVAAPMSATALSEVVILLGFAAAIGWPLELSHVAGFIAVIGTGVDDLVIIADEIKQQGEVSSQRVFQSRFRKAFWVIGAAAATTIVAMSPLAVLNLGDLRGFAIITILGVLIGVAITRPAYGSILRKLTTGEH